jgi:hypothetical protein
VMFFLMTNRKSTNTDPDRCILKAFYFYNAYME